MKYLVTGGAGFIGSHVTDLLIECGHQVVVLDNLSSGRRENLNTRADLVEGDIRDRETVRRCVDGVDGVFHLAAFISVPQSFKQIELCLAVNHLGLINIIREAVAAGVRKVVFSSSSAVYQADYAGRQREDLNLGPISPYGMTKLDGEYLLHMYCLAEGLGWCALRYYNVFGPRQNPASQYAAVIPRFISLALAGETLTINGSGEQTRDFIYIADVARANLTAMESEVSGVFNVGMGGKLTINDLARVILEVTDSPSPVVHGPPISGDIFASQADITRITEGLGWAPQSDFRDALEKTVDCFRA